MIALVDCNNFYASCERVFNPTFCKRPVCVLSNNDGCVVARSQEAKDIGVPMGAPYFKWKNVLNRHNAVVLSSNYTLYGDMSRRVMQTLKSFSPSTEIYSIDEAFLNLDGVRDLNQHAQRLRATVQQHTGITVSVGLGQTKVLAKLANKRAKKSTSGVCNLADYSSSQFEEILTNTEVEDVWGIGRRMSEKLHCFNIKTSKQFRDTADSFLRKHFTVVGLRLAYELRGTRCLDFDAQPSPKKQIQCARSFGSTIKDKTKVRESIAWHTSQAAVKLRAQGSVTSSMAVFLRTNPFRQQDVQYRNSTVVSLPHPTDDTAKLIQAALAGFESIWRPKYRYHKSGVMLMGLSPAGLTQFNLFTPATEVRNQALMSTLDSLNAKFGRDTVRYCATGVKRQWAMKSGKRTPAYSTCWREVLVV